MPSAGQGTASDGCSGETSLEAAWRRHERVHKNWYVEKTFIQYEGSMKIDRVNPFRTRLAHVYGFKHFTGGCPTRGRLVYSIPANVVPSQFATAFPQKAVGARSPIYKAPELPPCGPAEIPSRRPLLFFWHFYFRYLYRFSRLSFPPKPSLPLPMA